jgi:WD40 repeat protein
MDIHPPLIELLGGRWRFEAPVAAVAWSADGSVAAFALSDGAVALVGAAWGGGPQARPRATGGLEVHPPTVPGPPVSRILAHEGPCRALIAQPGGGLLSGGEDGRVARISLDGSVDVGAQPAMQRVELLAGGSAGWACASGHKVVVTRTSRRALTFPAKVRALAFDPTGHRLAVAYQDGVSICHDDGAQARHLAYRGLPLAVAWSPDGAWLALGLTAGSLRVWRSDDSADVVPGGGHSRETRSLGFSADGHMLAASGGSRVLYWRLNPPGFAKPGECGLRSDRAPVKAVAWHPVHPLIAAGYASGAILLCRPGVEDVLFIRGAGGGAALWLAWSADGNRLAFATEAGEAGLVILPHELFRGITPPPARDLRGSPGR